MLLQNSLLSALAIASIALAAPATKRWNQKTAKCRSFYAPIWATATNIDLKSVIGGANVPANQQVLIAEQINQFKAGSTLGLQIAAAPTSNYSATYSLYFEYCEPASGATPKGVFQTIHGVVANAGYWNVQIDGTTDNSFVEAATSAGWAVLSYDRLGVRNSPHPDGINIVQILLEVEQAIQISKALRSGKFSGVGPFSTVVAVGHSYGSQMLSKVPKVAPTAFDVVVLTGFSLNSTMSPLSIASFDPTIANVAYPSRFSDLANYYVITENTYADQKGFFHYPNYTESALELFTATKSEFALAEPLSSAAVGPYNSSEYTSPTFIITGEGDGPFCAGNCYSTSLGPGKSQLDAARPYYSGVADSDFATHVVADTGHGINYHTTARAAYQTTLDFVTAHLK